MGPLVSRARSTQVRNDQVARLLEIVEPQAQIGLAANGVAFATIRRLGVSEDLEIRSENFRRWVTFQYWQKRREIPSKRAVYQIVDLLDAIAAERGPAPQAAIRDPSQTHLTLNENPTLRFLQTALQSAPQNCYVKFKDVMTALQGYVAETMSAAEARRMKSSPKWVGTALQQVYPDALSDRVASGSIRVRRGLAFSDAGLLWLNRGWQIEDPTYVSKDTARLAQAQGSDTPRFMTPPISMLG
jgi:hypothetical protein